MAKRTTYTHLSQIQDPALRSALKIMQDRLGTLQNQADAIGAVSRPLDDHLDSAGHRVTALADPVAGTDAVNLQTLERHMNTSIRQALRDAGVLPLPPSEGGPGRGTGGGAGLGGQPSPPPPPTPEPPPAPPGPDPPPQEGTGLVRCGGRAFHYTDGTIWPWRGSTDARLYEFWLTGAAIDPVLDERIAAGANLFRVFGMYAPSSFIGDFNPASYGNYYSQLGPFADHLAAKGAWLEFTVFVNVETVIPSLTAQAEHFGAVFAQLSAKPRVFMELGNEWENNGFNPGNFARPTGLLHSRASGIIGSVPFRPCWDYITHHPERGPLWPRSGKELIELRDGYAGWAPVNRPVVADEPMGAAETASDKRSNVPEDFYYFGANCQMMGAGATFHSSNGLQSALFEPTTLLCANSFYAGLAAVDPAAQIWSYTNFGFTDFPIDAPPDFLKCYAKLDAPGGQGVCLVIRPGGTFAPVGRDGWTIAAVAGPHDCLMYLTK